MTDTEHASIESKVAISDIDCERFGVRIARAPEVSHADVAPVLARCHELGAAMLIVRCPTEDLAAAQALEAAGARLMDTLVYYGRALFKGEIPEDTCTVPVRPMRDEEADRVRTVAAESFKDYYGHYHADPRLDRAKCDEAYQSWAHRSGTSRGPSSEVLVADLGGRVEGFATLRLNDPTEGEGVLFAVSPAAQGRGIYRSFMIQGMRWSKEKGAKRMVVSTQITNKVVQKVWVKLGFEPTVSFYTFHLWFDAP